MSRYDYGLRGARETFEPRFRRRGRNWRDADFDAGGRQVGGAYRVTAPYNLDYVRDVGDRRPIDDARHQGTWRERLDADRAYRHSYITRGGTRTSRGVPPPTAYDYRDYGPDFGGRYPDEL
jgi:hypothetical protein